MIDWLKLRLHIEAREKIPADRMFCMSPDGEVKWEKLRPYEVRGSYEANVHVSTCPVTGFLVIDGNPVKFFQGHNVFGTDDIHGLAEATISRVIETLHVNLSDAERAEIDSGAVDVARVDLTEMYSTGTQLYARAAVRAVSDHGSFKHRGRGLLKEGTVYFGKHSRRSALKIYAKGDELVDHPLPKELPYSTEVVAWAADKLRVEVVLRGMELKTRGLDALSSWKPETGVTLYREFLGKLNMPDNIELPPAALEGLPARLQLAYSAWLRGDDLRVTLPRKTFYRYRKALLEHGIDIGTLQAREPKSNVIPMIRLIELRPAPVPEWAVGTPLYFEPRRRQIA